MRRYRYCIYFLYSIVLKQQIMAKVNGNIILEKHSGAIGKQLVYRQFNGKTVVSKYPDRSKVIYTPEQLQYRKIFAIASKYASDIVKDPVKEGLIR